MEREKLHLRKITGEITIPAHWKEGREKEECITPQKLLNAVQEMALVKTGGA